MCTETECTIPTHAQRQNAPFLLMHRDSLPFIVENSLLINFCLCFFMECKLLIIQGYLQIYDPHACMHALNLIESA